MSFPKVLKDHLIKFLNGPKTVPEGLVELQRYFRNNKPIHFTYYTEDGLYIAVSENFRYGSITTFAENKKELDAKIKDAILTAFDIPSSFAKEAKVVREDEKEMAYAAA